MPVKIDNTSCVIASPSICDSVKISSEPQKSFKTFSLDFQNIRQTYPKQFSLFETQTKQAQAIDLSTVQRYFDLASGQTKLKKEATTKEETSNRPATAKTMRAPLSLTKAEKNAIDFYTYEAGPLDSSPVCHYRNMNLDGLSPENPFFEKAQNLSSAISKLSTGNIIKTYRGTTAKDRFNCSLKENVAVKSNKFLSTSVYRHVAQDFAYAAQERQQDRAFVTVFGKSGANIERFSYTPDEREILYNKSTEFTLLLKKVFTPEEKRTYEKGAHELHHKNRMAMDFISDEHHKRLAGLFRAEEIRDKDKSEGAETRFIQAQKQLDKTFDEATEDAHKTHMAWRSLRPFNDQVLLIEEAGMPNGTGSIPHLIEALDLARRNKQ